MRAQSGGLGAVPRIHAATLPRGIGLDVSGTVDALGEGVEGVGIGDLVFGVPDFMGCPTAGASEYAILAVWESVPEGLDLLAAAALPMAVETSVRCLDLLGLSAGQTILINGVGRWWALRPCRCRWSAEPG